jgi:tripartite-type tricarboxylate transporter receptor subunit TctC
MLAMTPALYQHSGKSLPYDPLNAFAPVTNAVTVPAVLAAHPSVPVRSLKDFVALVKRQPGKINVACPGVGSIAHLILELFKNRAKIDFVFVPYRGGAPALTDVLGGHVGYMATTLSTATPQIQADRLIGLAVSSGKRFSGLPNMPTIAESGYPGFEAEGWLGILSPAGTPGEIVTRLHREITAVLEMPELHSKLGGRGVLIKPSDSPGSFNTLMRDELAMWKQLVQEANIKVK